MESPSTGRSVGSPGTRARILDAAERLFARHGFAATSVRDITAEAGSNVAAVNYHFGGKENLYREVFARVLGMLREGRLAGIDRARPPGGGPPALEDLLRSFTLAFLEPYMARPDGAASIELISRELLDPRLPANFFRSELMEPVEEALAREIRAACGPIADGDLLRSIHSLIAQLVHSIHCRRLEGKRMDGVSLFTFPGVVDHIVRFTAAGIRALAAVRPAGARKPPRRIEE